MINLFNILFEGNSDNVLFENGKIKLQISDKDRATLIDGKFKVDSLIQQLKQLHFTQTPQSQKGITTLVIDMNDLGITQEEIDQVSQIKPGVDVKVGMVKLVSRHLRDTLVATKSAEIDELAQKIFENYEEVGGELVSKKDRTRTGISTDQVKETLAEAALALESPYDLLPTLSLEETKNRTANFKDGQFLLRKSKNKPGHLVIAKKVKGRTKQVRLSPGSKPNTFIHINRKKENVELTLDKIIRKYGGRSKLVGPLERVVPGKVRLWKNEEGKHAYVAKKLGQGGGSKVYLFLDIRNGRIGAFKDALRRSKKVSVEQTKADVANEYDILSKIHGEEKAWGIQEKPNICEIIRVKTKYGLAKDRYGYIGRQYSCSYFDLIMRGIQNKDVKFDDILTDFHQMLSGLNTLASKGYLHGDIKAENIFVDETGELRRVYIADMGGACHQTKEVENLRDLVAGGGKRPASPEYTSNDDLIKSKKLARKKNKPELIQLEKKRDVFAMGCILYSSLTGYNPFSEVGNANTFYGWPDESAMLVKGVPDDLAFLVEDMLNADDTARPDAATVFDRFKTFLKDNHPDLLKKIEEQMKS
jgi:hypothetical protein